MHINLEKSINNEGIIKIKIIKDDYQKDVEQKFKELIKKVNIKGFRSGKVPIGLIKKLYGKSVIGDVVEQIVSTNLNDYMRNSELEFVLNPIPDNQNISLDFNLEEEFEFIFKVGYADDFEVCIDKNFKLNKYEIIIDEAVIQGKIVELRNQSASEVNIETITEHATIKGIIHSEKLSLSKSIEFKAINLSDTGLKVLFGRQTGESIALRSEYFESDSKLTELVGEDISDTNSLINDYILEIETIKEIKIPDINQQFFNRIFGEDVVKTIEEFKEQISDSLQKKYRHETQNYFQSELKKFFLKKIKFALPDDFLRKWLKSTNKKISPEEIDNNYKKYAEELKWSLISRKIATKNSLKVGHDEIIAETEKHILQQFGGRSIEQNLKNEIKKLADNYLKGENGENYLRISDKLQSDKVLDFLENEIIVEEQKITEESFKDLINNSYKIDQLVKE